MRPFIHFFISLLVFVNVYYYSTKAEVYSALSHTERMLSIELELGDALESYIKAEEERLRKLKIFTRRLQQTLELAKKTGTKFLGHPVNSYLMLKRFVTEWPKMDEIVSTENPAEGILMDKFEQYKPVFPGWTDLNGAVEAIKRLQDVYALKPEDFSEGRFGQKSSSSEYMLGPVDTYLIGQVSYQDNDYVSTRDWMRETLRLMELGVHSDTEYPSRLDVLDHLAFSEYKTDDLEEATKHEIEALKLDPENARVRRNVLVFGQLLEENPEKYKKKKEEEKKVKRVPSYKFLSYPISQETFEDFNWYVERDIYKRLCRGEKIPKPPQDKQRLKCWYDSKNPLCVVKRCGIERVFTNPDILLLKNIITEQEIQKVKQISEPLLNRATVHNPLTGHLETANYRISKNCWLTGKEHGEVIQRIENRIAAMTKLDLATAEGFQVQNYGLAGQYDPHFDFSRNLSNSSLGKLGTGNRLATVLVYMSQVESGGATVFPYIGARVLPQKGDAVFWHNLRRSGLGDFRTRHAGCPVLSGIKWVANKWIHEYGNEFNRPCSLKPDE